MFVLYGELLLKCTGRIRMTPPPAARFVHRAAPRLDATGSRLYAPRWLARCQSTAEVQAAVSAVVARGGTVRVVGTEHSWGASATSGGGACGSGGLCVIDVRGMDRLLKVVEVGGGGDGGGRMVVVVVQAGMLLRDLVRHRPGPPKAVKRP
jgi:FAD/FMN-containing dehydrogenase